MSKDWPEETDGNKRHDEWMERKERDKREREREISVYDAGYDQTLFIYQNSISNVAREEFPAMNCGS